MYFVRGTVSAEVADASGGTEELKTRYKGVDTVLRTETITTSVRQSQKQNLQT